MWTVNNSYKISLNTFNNKFICIFTSLYEQLINKMLRPSDNKFNKTILTFYLVQKTVYLCSINLLKTKRNLLYIRNQSAPRSKHFPPRL